MAFSNQRTCGDFGGLTRRGRKPCGGVPLRYAKRCKFHGGVLQQRAAMRHGVHLRAVLDADERLVFDGVYEDLKALVGAAKDGELAVGDELLVTTAASEYVRYLRAVKGNLATKEVDAILRGLTRSLDKLQVTPKTRPADSGGFMDFVGDILSGEAPKLPEDVKRARSADARAKAAAKAVENGQTALETGDSRDPVEESGR